EAAQRLEVGGGRRLLKQLEIGLPEVAQEPPRRLLAVPLVAVGAQEHTGTQGVAQQPDGLEIALPVISYLDLQDAEAGGHVPPGAFQRRARLVDPEGDARRQAIPLHAQETNQRQACTPPGEIVE